MFYFDNYYVYGEFLKNNQNPVIYTKDITRNTYDQYLDGLVNLLRDGVETPEVQGMFIKVIFPDGNDVELTVVDLMYNVILWNLFVSIDEPIESRYVYFEENISGDSIKEYMDELFIEPNRRKIENRRLNNILCDTIFKFMIVDEFDMYLCNTINLKDFVTLMNDNPRAYELLHKNYDDVTLDKVTKQGEEDTDELVDIIKNSDHCLSDSFRTHEGTNVKQFKEFAVNIGTKPDNRGSIYPHAISRSYINGGLQNIMESMIDSSTGRIAQILSKNNVGDAGHFSRILRLNNSDTVLNSDPNYKCNTHNLQHIHISSAKMLNRLNNRWYKLSENGLDHVIKAKHDKHLIGKDILLYSPMTCESFAHGKGICYRCYGELAYTNNDINVGIIASETLADPLTQRLLSAKHLLASAVKEVIWPEEFGKLFIIDNTSIYLRDDINPNGYKILIDPDKINLVEEFEDFAYNEYITEFDVRYPDGTTKTMYNSNNTQFYFSSDFSNIIRDKSTDENDTIIIDLADVKDIELFSIMLENFELSKTLNEITEIINKQPVTSSFDRNQILQSLVEVVIGGKINVDSIHLEVILANQLRRKDNILEKPEWEYPNEPYQLISLGRALTNNPSPTISLSYEKIAQALYNPITYTKTAPSIYDTLFVENPVEYLSDTYEEEEKPLNGVIKEGLVPKEREDTK